jgi:hypothetical protein
MISPFVALAFATQQDSLVIWCIMQQRFGTWISTSLIWFIDPFFQISSIFVTSSEHVHTFKVLRCKFLSDLVKHVTGHVRLPTH